MPRMDSRGQYTRLSPLTWLVVWQRSFDRILLDELDRLVRSPRSLLSEWVVGDGSILLVSKKPVSQDWVRTLLSGHAIETPTEGVKMKGNIHFIEVEFNGPDLAATADYFSMAKLEYIEAFCAVDYEVGFMGFAPGFGYLTGGEVSSIPRLNSPRQTVVKGAVAVAAGYTSVYPADSPGGWNWIGQATVNLFNSSAEGEDKFLLSPSDHVKFIAIS